MIRFAASLALTLAFAGSLAVAQESGSGMEGMDHSGEMAADPALQPFMKAMDGMMKTMPKQSAGDPDADFVLMMIPHHQSAIDMARVELELGDDEEVRAMAQAIIDAQEKEIAEMRAILERMKVEAPAATETVTTDDSGMAGEPVQE